MTRPAIGLILLLGAACVAGCSSPARTLNLTNTTDENLKVVISGANGMQGAVYHLGPSESFVHAAHFDTAWVCPDSADSAARAERPDFAAAEGSMKAKIIRPGSEKRVIAKSGGSIVVEVRP